MISSSSQYCHDDVDVDFDDRTIVMRTMRKLESSVYKRPRAQMMPEMYSGLWRRQIVEWMYVLIKHCKLKHEATAAAVYYLDAAVMCSSSSSLVNSPRDYQLCAMTALYLALKVFDSPTMRVVKLSCLVKLGNGEFTEDDIIKKEHDLVRALGWRLNPPTADCFFHRYMELLPFIDDDDNDECEHHVDVEFDVDVDVDPDVDTSGKGDENLRKDVERSDQLTPKEHRRRERQLKLEEVASEFIEVAMARDRFICVPPSVIAYAALLSAMELTTKHEQQQQQQQNCHYDWSTFLHNMSDIAEMGDIFGDFGAEIFNEDNRGGVARAVRRTKMLLDRIVKGLVLPPEEEDDAFFNIGSSRSRRLSINAGESNINNNENSISAECTKPSTLKSSSPPSPTSTVSSVNTASLPR